MVELIGDFTVPNANRDSDHACNATKVKGSSVLFGVVPIWLAY